MSNVDEETIREIVRDELSRSSTTISRRGLLGALGLAGGAAVFSGNAAATQFPNAGQGMIGTADYPLEQVNSEQGNFEQITLNGQTETSWPSGAEVSVSEDGSQVIANASDVNFESLSVSNDGDGTVTVGETIDMGTL